MSIALLQTMQIFNTCTVDPLTPTVATWVQL